MADVHMESVIVHTLQDDVSPTCSGVGQEQLSLTTTDIKLEQNHQHHQQQQQQPHSHPAALLDVEDDDDLEAVAFPVAIIEDDSNELPFEAVVDQKPLSETLDSNEQQLQQPLSQQQETFSEATGSSLPEATYLAPNTTESFISDESTETALIPVVED